MIVLIEFSQVPTTHDDCRQLLKNESESCLVSLITVAKTQCTV